MRTEREKMLAGEYYFSHDPELIEMRVRARLLLEQYNLSSVVQPEIRQQILADLFGYLPKGINIQPPFLCDYGPHIKLGESVFINFGCKILDICHVSIGNRVLIGPNVGFYAASHPLDADLRRQGVELGKPIVVGDDCWIGGNTVILPGVTVGDRTVIGAGSVVTKNLPSDVLAVGNPARVIRQLKPSEERTMGGSKKAD